ncbi:MAG TPA: glycosyl transferase family 36 [Armatimonadota bacterium]|jgi:cellobiose phosphorylase
MSSAHERAFDSPYGHFSEDGREYVITRPDTPRPWVNVLTNGDYGCIVSQAGGGFSWRGNSQLRMLNRWDQDLICDACGRFLYLKDDATGAVWSADYQPTRQTPKAFRMRHGLGYTVTELARGGVRCEKTVFVPLDAPCEVWRVRLTNESAAPVALSLYPYLEWQLGAISDWHREFHKTFMETEWLEDASILYAWKRGEVDASEPPFAGFLAVAGRAADGYDADKESFLGRYGDPSAPAALRERSLAGRTGSWNDSVGALQARLPLAPSETREVVFVVGAGSRDEARTCVHRFGAPGAVDAALEGVKGFWAGIVDGCRVETPDPALDLMTNVWLKYQAIAGRMWARTGYYQNSGAFGFRDQLQDSHIWMPLEPDRARSQILMHAGHQFANGTVQHWWHTCSNIAAVTDCSDDLLWLSYLAMNWIDETDDVSLWDAPAPFQDGGEAPMYDHCVRAFDKVFTRFSPRGLPLIGDCDWNDGLSHAGRKWKGESVWLAHFLTGLLRRFAEHAGERADSARAADYRRRADALVAAINEHCWDGEWYWRATTDNGRKIGSHECAENRIDLIAQAWSVINATAPPERARQAMASAQKHLFREYGPLLLTPAYSRTDPDIGYITRYAPGVRENGGVYTHAATWGVQALAMLGEGDAAWAAYASMSPPRRGTDPELYFAEPYVTPGNVDGPDSPTFGRGGWTWYTGSAAWMQKVALEWICGVRAVRKGLLIDPCIPAAWPSFKVHRRFRGAEYDIEVVNPHGRQKGVACITVDGCPIEGPVIPPFPAGGTHAVRVAMG